MSPSRLKTFWLSGFLILVFMMIAVGGITRLTRSGLSIVEWRPVTGLLPPLTEDQWKIQFELYQKSPEFQIVNSHFSLKEYKSIFFWEYLHRLLGRLIFFFSLMPGAWLWRKKQIHGKTVIQLTLLVAVQGLVGWLMVKTGLNTRPSVSPFMLALHFFFALGLLTGIFSQFFQNQRPQQAEAQTKDRLLFLSLGLLMIFQIFYGCLTSGFKAGFAFNTYPLMGDSFWPPAGLGLTPVWLNIFENPILIQWIHRWLGASVLISCLVTAWSFSKFPALKKAFLFLIAVICLQVSLGILNLLWGVPVPLAALHQSVAALLVLAYLNILFRLPGLSKPGLPASL